VHGRALVAQFLAVRVELVRAETVDRVHVSGPQLSSGVFNAALRDSGEAAT
jgi:hypothetical protein